MCNAGSFQVEYHCDCLELAEALSSGFLNPESRVDILINNSLQHTIHKNRHILRLIVRAILLLAKQGIAYRGKEEDLESSQNPGNFLSLLRTFGWKWWTFIWSSYNTRVENTTHLSPSTQDDIINIIDFDIVHSGIVLEIKNAR